MSHGVPPGTGTRPFQLSSQGQESSADNAKENCSLETSDLLHAADDSLRSGAASQNIENKSTDDDEKVSRSSRECDQEASGSREQAQARLLSDHNPLTELNKHVTKPRLNSRQHALNFTSQSCCSQGGRHNGGGARSHCPKRPSTTFQQRRVMQKSSFHFVREERSDASCGWSVNKIHVGSFTNRVSDKDHTAARVAQGGSKGKASALALTKDASRSEKRHHQLFAKDEKEPFENPKMSTGGKRSAPASSRNPSASAASRSTKDTGRSEKQHRQLFAKDEKEPFENPKMSASKKRSASASSRNPSASAASRSTKDAGRSEKRHRQVFAKDEKEPFENPKMSASRKWSAPASSRNPPASAASRSTKDTSRSEKRHRQLFAEDEKAPEMTNGKRGAPASSRNPPTMSARRNHPPIDVLDSSDDDRLQPKHKRRPFADAEDEAILAGVKECGEGNWKAMRVCGHAVLHSRSTVNIKDRHRVLKKCGKTEGMENFPDECADAIADETHHGSSE